MPTDNILTEPSFALCKINSMKSQHLFQETEKLTEVIMSLILPALRLNIVIGDTSYYKPNIK